MECTRGETANTLGRGPSGGNPLEVRILSGAPVSASVVKLADTRGLGPRAFNGIRVRILSGAPIGK